MTTLTLAQLEFSSSHGVITLSLLFCPSHNVASLSLWLSLSHGMNILSLVLSETKTLKTNGGLSSIFD
ncbi:hypothetical protein TorRG33x02_343940 [Trema orientale]|uniref:Uncharacterized protein n=1 Tax=Trema orientale TaxID=63057 RepID=A0A2P5AQZ0_TREOI|nr:hypothetical protein TorRG33x02_343940 [Trema orientale]